MNDGLKLGFIDYEQKRIHSFPENSKILDKSDQKSQSTKNSSNAPSTGSIHYIIQPKYNTLKV